MFALIDPNWGEPKVIGTTVRETEEEAWEAAIRCEEAKLYSGASQHPLPHGTLGSKEALISHGFNVSPVRVEIIKSK